MLKMTETNDIEKLVDKEFKSKKTRSLKVADLMDKCHFGSDDQRKLMHECGSYLAFYASRDFQHRKLHEANFCKSRFCPLCAWRKASKDAEMLATVMTALRKEKELDFLFLTLTVPNVSGDDLKRTITQINRAFFNLLHRKKFSFVLGFARKLELTYNANSDTYHPHLHCILAVRPSYFKSDAYLGHDAWLSEWQSVCHDSSITQVSIQKIDFDKKPKGKNGRKKKGEKTALGAVLEVAKYATKDEDFTKLSTKKDKKSGLSKGAEVFMVFYAALKGRQLLSFGGCFKDYVAEYKAGKLDKYKPDHATVMYYWLLVGSWSDKKQNYKSKYRRLTDEEKKEIRKQQTGESQLEKMADKKTIAFATTQKVFSGMLRLTEQEKRAKINFERKRKRGI